MTLKPDEHVTAWIGAYYDGELSGDLLRKVEDHLNGCPACMAELESLGSLSSILHADPLPAGANSATPPEIYASRVVMLLPREQKRAPRQRAGSALRAAWRYAPAGLFIGWAFFQAALLVSWGLLWLIRVVPQAREGLEWLLPLTEGAQIGWFGFGPVIDPLLLADFILTGVTAALFATWLASWWAVHNRPAGFEEQNI